MWKTIDYEKTHLDSMIEMIQENYGSYQSISNKDFLNHWYFSNPSGAPIIKLAIDNDNGALAGQYVIAPRKYMFFGETINSVLSLDTLTRSAYRGKGIFTGLAKSAFNTAQNNGFKFCYGAPNQNSHPGFIKKLGFVDLCEMPLYIRPLKISRIIKEKLNKVMGVLCYPLNLFSIVGKINDTNILEITNQNVRIMDDFWNQISNKYSIIGIRNATYIKYRYLNVPTREYYPFVYVTNNKPVAYVVARIREVAKMTTGMIADFIFVKGYEKQAIKLVKFICRRLKDMGAGLSGCIMMSHSDETKILKKTHFVKCPRKILPQPTPLIIRTFDKELDKQGIMDAKKWFFTTGDYDVV